MAGSLAIPNTFGTQSGNVPANQLDSNYTTIADYVNDREITLGTLAARPAAGVSGRWYFATDSNGGQLYEDNGSSWTAITGGLNPPFVPLGTSRISRTDATHIALGVGVIPLKVSGAWVQRPITSAVSKDTTGLSSSTVYFVYAFDNAGSTALELSTTGHATDADYGVEIKSGDATRTLVGMVRTNGSTQFVDTAAQRFVISWFNRRSVAGLNRLTTADGTATGTSYSELSTTLLRAEFLTWATEAVQLTAAGAAQTVTNNGFIALGIDNTTAVSAAFINSADQSGQTVLIYKNTLAEGYHFGTVLGKIITTGTVTAFGSTSLGGETTSTMTIQIIVQG